MIKMGGFICDKCRRVIAQESYDVPVIWTTASGEVHHFCTSTCYDLFTCKSAKEQSPSTKTYGKMPESREMKREENHGQSE
jgi:hypothetical protein